MYSGLLDDSHDKKYINRPFSIRCRLRDAIRKTKALFHKGHLLFGRNKDAYPGIDSLEARNAAFIKIKKSMLERFFIVWKFN